MRTTGTKQHDTAGLRRKNHAGKTNDVSSTTQTDKATKTHAKAPTDAVDRESRPRVDDRARRHAFDPAEVKHPSEGVVHMPAATAARMAQIERMTDPKAAVAALADLFANYDGPQVARADRFSETTGKAVSFKFEAYGDWGSRVTLEHASGATDVGVHAKVGQWLRDNVLDDHKGITIKDGKHDIAVLPGIDHANYKKSVRLVLAPPVSRAELMTSSTAKEMGPPQTAPENHTLRDSPQRTLVEKALSKAKSLDKALPQLADFLLNPGAQWIGKSTGFDAKTGEPKGAAWAKHVDEPRVFLHHAFSKNVDLSPELRQQLQEQIVDGNQVRFLTYGNDRYALVSFEHDAGGGSLVPAGVELVKLEKNA